MLMIWWMNAVRLSHRNRRQTDVQPFQRVSAFLRADDFFGAFGSLFGMLFLNRLPRLHHPLFKHRRFALATHDRFFIVIETSDPKVFRN